MSSKRASRGPRPITTALTILARMPRGKELRSFTHRSHARLVRILTELNAASGTTDTRSAKRRAATIRRRAKSAR